MDNFEWHEVSKELPPEFDFVFVCIPQKYDNGGTAGFKHLKGDRWYTIGWWWKNKNGEVCWANEAHLIKDPVAWAYIPQYSGEVEE